MHNVTTKITMEEFEVGSVYQSTVSETKVECLGPGQSPHTFSGKLLSEYFGRYKKGFIGEAWSKECFIKITSHRS